jgi:hypothetical protein
MDNIYIADTYNHAMRAIELIEQKVSTLVGKQEVKTIYSIDDPLFVIP